MLGKDELFDEIMLYDFALADVTLFLDTHPHDKEAFKYYKDASQRLQKVKAEYEKKYGSLSNRNVSGDTYNYVHGPWPWEGEASCGCMKNDYNFQ